MRISGKICWLLSFITGLILILSLGTVLAQEERIDLTLRLIPDDYYKEVTPGEEQILYLEIHNTGNKPVTNIRLSSDEPEGWVVRFNPLSIDYLGAGSSQTVDVSVMPAINTEKGKYRLNLIAEADQTKKVITTFLRVDTANSMWLEAGIVVASLVVAGFVFIYMRFGRQ
ncbi:NEW3 domain-containing protein [Chloroflexota bacterium]